MTRRVVQLLVISLLAAGCGNGGQIQSARLVMALQVRTEKGVFTVPGAAYADGRDLEATPPFAVSEIGVWDSSARRRETCRVSHAAEVWIDAVEQNKTEGRLYFRIISGGCEGWLPEASLSPTLPV